MRLDGASNSTFLSSLYRRSIQLIFAYSKKSKIQSTNLTPGLLNGLLSIVASLTQSEQAELDGTAGDDDGDDDLRVTGPRRVATAAQGAQG